MTAPFATLAQGFIRASPTYGFGRRAYSPNPLPGGVLNEFDSSRMAGRVARGELVHNSAQFELFCPPYNPT